eukprot:3397581-Rhodomonas_salina.1
MGACAEAFSMSVAESRRVVPGGWERVQRRSPGVAPCLIAMLQSPNGELPSQNTHLARTRNHRLGSIRDFKRRRLWAGKYEV